MSSAPQHRATIRWKVGGALLGALLFGLIGAGYGAYLHFNPEYREAIISGALSQPHMDSERYVASVVALRYQSFWELMQTYGLFPMIGGALLGAASGAILEHLRFRRRFPAAADPDLKFSVIDVLTAAAVIAVLLTLFQPNHGLVYYQGKDQFYWLHRLESPDAAERPEAVEALTTLLRGRPFPCRATIIAALAKRGEEAEYAVATVERLTQDEEETVRRAAVEAMAKLKGGKREP